MPAVSNATARVAGSTAADALHVASEVGLAKPWSCSRWHDVAFQVLGQYGRRWWWQLPQFLLWGSSVLLLQLSLLLSFLCWRRRGLLLLLLLLPDRIDARGAATDADALAL